MAFIYAEKGVGVMAGGKAGKRPEEIGAEQNIKLLVEEKYA